MITPQQWVERQAKLDAARADRQKTRAQIAVWPTPDDATVEIAPGRGDLTYTSGSVPTVPVALQLVGPYTVSFARLYMSQPWVAAAILRMLTWASRVPLHVYKRATGDPNSNVKLGPQDHPLAEAIERPWQRGSQLELIQAMLGPALVYGNSVIEMGLVNNSQIVLRAHDWRFCRPNMPRRDDLVGFIFDYDQPYRQDVPIERVLHTRWWSPISPLGVSPLQQLMTTIQIEDAAQRMQRSSLQNANRTSGVVTMHEDYLGYDVKERQQIMQFLRDDVTALHAGPENAGRPMLLPPGLDWHVMAQTNAEAALIEQRKITREEIAAVFNIPPPLIGILDRATYSNIQCVGADALISTIHGPVKACDICAGDRVFAVRDGELKPSVVSWAGQTGYAPLVTIRTLNRTLHVTDNHPVLIARRKKNNKPWLEWTPAGQLEPGDMVVQAEKLPAYGVRCSPTRAEVSEGYMEFCGLWVGDGSISRNKKDKAVQVQIARADDARYIGHYKDVMRTEFQKADGSAVAVAEGVRRTLFCSTVAAQEIAELDFGHTAKTKHIPEWVFELEPDLRAAFLRGFFDADGTVDKKGHVIVSLCNETLLRQIRELCISVGVPVSNVRAKRREVTLPQGTKFFSVMWTFSCGDPQANAEIVGSHDPQDMKRMREGRPWDRSYTYGAMTTLPKVEGCAYSKVLSVERGECSVPVYNITVPDGQNFVVEGVVTHNTQRDMVYTDVVGPQLVLLEQTINAQLVRDFLQDEEVFVAFDFAAVLRGDRLQEINAIREAIGMALLTPNEGRGILGERKLIVPGMDSAYLPLVNNLVEIGSETSPGGTLATPATAPQEPGEAPDEAPPDLPGQPQRGRNGHRVIGQREFKEIAIAAGYRQKDW